MINFPYLKNTFRSNAGLLAIFTAVLCLFLTAICIVFKPDSGIAIIQGGGTLNAFLANSFYAVMAVIFPMVYSIIVGNGLIAKKIDDTSMAAYLSTPVSRGKVVGSSALYFILSHVVMWAVVSVLGIILGTNLQADYFDVGQFLLLNLGALLYHLAISSISFCASCVFSSSKKSLLAGAGIPLISFILSLLTKFSDSLEAFKYLTLSTLFDTSAILSGEGYIPQFIALGAITVVLYTVGIVVFKKKSLPL